MSTANPAPAKTPNFPQHTPVADRDAGPNFSAARVGPLKDLIRYAVDSPRLGLTLPGKVFLQDVLGLTGMEVSLGLMPPHASIPFLHKHDQNEEVYLFLRGRGEMLVDGRVVPVSEGTAVRVAPDGVRCWRNTSDDDLVYLVIQAKAGSLEQWTGTDGIGVPEPPSWPTPA